MSAIPLHPIANRLGWTRLEREIINVKDAVHNAGPELYHPDSYM